MPTFGRVTMRLILEIRTPSSNYSFVFDQLQFIGSANSAHFSKDLHCVNELGIPTFCRMLRSK